MKDGIARLRMFAGPNGSGKSTLKTALRRELQGVYLNPDEMEKEMRERGFLDLAAFSSQARNEDLQAFFKNSTLLAKAGMGKLAERISIADGRMKFGPDSANSYVASVTADFFRQELLAQRKTFTLETVMSHPGKIALLQQAQLLGYRTYLYFIATDDPDINISRVRTRVKQGGHPVPEARIVSRYHASLALLMEAIKHTNRAYIFDNSGDGKEKTWLAEITEGRALEMRTDRLSAWFKHAVWDKIASPAS